MGKFETILNAFNAGELSPWIPARQDFDKYYKGAAVIQNFLPRLEGGLVKRPGMFYVAPIKYEDRDTILVEFQFNVEQSYVLEFGHLYMRVCRDGEQVTDDQGATYELTTPYTEEEIRRLRFTPSADTMYITHPDHPPAKLTRSGHADWNISEIRFYPPATRIQDQVLQAYLTPSAITGTGVTFTATHGVFRDGDALKQIVFGASRAVITSVTTDFIVVADILDDWEDLDPMPIGDWVLRGSPWAWLHPANTGPKGAVLTFYTTNFDTGARLHCFRATDVGRYIIANNGMARIVSFVDRSTVTAEILRELNFADPTKTWTMESEAWNAESGYPACSCFYENRLVFSGVPAYPETIWGSVVDDYESFVVGIEDDDSYQFSLVSRHPNVVRWIEGEKVLHAGTAATEWRIGARDSSEPTTPLSLPQKQETTLGSADLPAISFMDVILFVQRSQRRIREIAYDYTTDSYKGPDLCILASHLWRRNTIIELKAQQEPTPGLWAVRDDGLLPFAVYDRANEVVAWCRIVTEGKFLSIAVIPSDGEEEQVWAIVEREIHGQTRRYIEYFGPQEWGEDLEDAHFVDCGKWLSYDTPTASITGLSHLAGCEVSILADAIKRTGRVTSAGTLTLPEAASEVHVGLAYTSMLETVPLGHPDARDGLQNRQLSVSHIALRLIECLGGRAGSSLDTLQDLRYWQDGMQMDSQVPLYTGDKDLANASDWGPTQKLYVVHDDPYPFGIAALLLQLGIGGSR